ncbi:hypothetical protein EAG_10174 [Camponotus floridanus]|uniref:Uncharacterized protein n=1 Tax=Camponotus floridanus TaxID=104421 RepID=E1ZVJ7_CAMFO|nr:hypothetical protein EAG_10174 [Camponotus floridanus]
MTKDRLAALVAAQSDDDDVADDVSVNVGAPDDFMTEFFAEPDFHVKDQFSLSSITSIREASDRQDNFARL